MTAFRAALLATALLVVAVSSLGTEPPIPGARGHPDIVPSACAQASGLMTAERVRRDGLPRIVLPRPGWVAPAVVGAAREPVASTSPQLPTGTGGDWPARVARDLAEREYEASRNAEGLQAPNRAHNLRTYFEPAGIRVVDRTAPGSPELLTLRMSGWGRGDQVAAVEAGEVMSAGRRVEIRRAGLVEWYENSAMGLEQGFTLEAAPEGEGPVVVELSVGGARVSPQGEGLALAAATGRQLEYGGLAVWDAAGTRLPARLDAGDAGLVRIVVEDAGARYPVVVDPLLKASGTLEGDQTGAHLGVSVAGAGDVDGDGYADVIVGAPNYDAGEVGEGVAFVFLGSATGVASGSPATAAAVLQSKQAGASLGVSVAGAGDVNGDGYADVIVGAPYYDSGQTDEGAAFVFLGSASGVASGSPATAAATLQSNQAGASLGVSVAGAGDVNGDGYADVIVGAPNYDAGDVGEGAAFVFLGSASGVASGSPATAATTLQSKQASAGLGSSVAGAGDVDGDGYADVIVGAHAYDAGESDEGAAFVFLGSASGVVSGSPATAAATLQSNQASAGLGSSVAGAGDVNGDGYADVIVGADRYDAGQADEGAAFVFLGSATGVESGSPATAAATLQSNQASAGLGVSVASVGDVNGDGYADVIVGAPHYSAGESNEGAAFLFLGAAAGIASGNPATAAATLQSDQASAGLGSSVAGAEDVNGDGYADVIVGADLYDAGKVVDVGAAFVFLGSAAGVPSGSQATAAATLQSNQASANLGFSVAGAGDVNGDGYADVIVGAPNYDAGEADEGAAFVFLGSATGVTSGNPATAATAMYGNQVNAQLGYSVAGAGDVNGDGYADVIVGARNYEFGQPQEGAAFVYLGSPAGVAPGSSAVLESDQGWAFMGSSVAGAGDVNGDGYADVIVGAPNYDAGQSNEGAAFVFHGSAAGVVGRNPATAAAILQSNQINAYLGSSVAGAGDVNGDGYADVIVGAPNYDAGQTNEGAAFVYLGSATGVVSGSRAVLQSDEAEAHLGQSVAGAGDVNGDGYADVIVGAPYYDAPEYSEGAAFVFLGSATGVGNGSPATAATTLLASYGQTHLGWCVAGAGDINGDGYADVIVGASFNLGAAGEACLFLGSAAGIPSGTQATAPIHLQCDQDGALLASSLAGAGDVNGDGYADVIVGASGYDAGQTDEGAAFVFLGGGGTTGRPILARQARGTGSGGTQVQPWGGSYVDGRFRLGMRGTDSWGRARVKLEAEYCPAGVAFGAAQCGHYVSPTWQDVTATAGGMTFDEPIMGLASSTLYHWRTRVLRAPYSVTQPGITAPPKPAHGPWRRLQGQAVEADVRTGVAGVAVESPPLVGALAIEGIRPNPAAGRFAVSFVLPSAGPAKLEVFDVAGRRVLARDLKASRVERQTMVLGDGLDLPAGIYLVRLSQSGRAVSARVAMLR
jgi:hypothetical protein